MRKTNTNAKPSSHLEAFLNLRCNVDLQLLEVFPSIKEITESMAMATACWKLDLPRNYPVTALCVGDGCTPRTGALLAHMTKWHVVSVDPKLRQDAKYDKAQRLYCIRERIENVEDERLWFYAHDNDVVIVACHSHASLLTSVNRVLTTLPRTVSVVSMECCKADDLPVQPDVEYVDKAVWSPKNQVRIWKPRNMGFWQNINVKQVVGDDQHVQATNR